jgi:hypothetical protein
LVQHEKGQMFPEDVQALSRWIWRYRLKKSIWHNSELKVFFRKVGFCLQMVWNRCASWTTRK